eukprot:m.78497 g.78497  ORF g.78497 m.78497 type:complete len:467 (-) comp11957_c0_seq2:180-1580(-)
MFGVFRAAAPRLLSAATRRITVATATPQPLRNALLTTSRFMSTDLPDHIVVDFPALSPTMTTGNIVSWEVAVGDEVGAGDSFGEVETDKATMSFISSDDGIVAKILLPEGTKNVDIGEPVIVLVDEAADVAAFEDFTPPASTPTEAPEETPAPAPSTPSETTSPNASAPVSTSSPTATTSADGSRIKASPLARRLAEQAQIALENLVGTGVGGRITEADVNAYADHKPAVSSGSGVVYEDLELSNVRKVIASRLLESKNTVPHYYLNLDVNADNAMELRKELNGKADGEYKLSMNDLVVKAASLALTDVKEVNSAWMGDYIRQYETVDISVAVSTDKGLITPIVFNADFKGLKEISADTKALAAKARENSLTPDEYQGGTFTISNLGMFGISRFTAIINPPQACILAVGTTEKKVVVDESSETGFGVQNTMSVTLSCDHRVVDGAVGAQWLAAFKKYFEDPMKMLL